MGSPDKQILRKVTDHAKYRFRHNDLAHEGARLLFHLHVQRDLDKWQHGQIDPTREIPSHAHKNDQVQMPQAPDAPVAAPSPDISDLLRNQVSFPSLPTIFSRLMDVMSDPLSSADTFAGVIMNDPALTARLLKLVNSSYYSFRSKIDTISNAVTIIGTNELYALCLTTSVMKLFKGIPAHLVDMASFWKHSLFCGVMAKKLARHKSCRDVERFFIAGILHDIGRIILYRELASLALKIMADARQMDALLYDMELNLLGFDHALIGGRLMKKWHLPKHLDHMVRFHHAPEESPDPEHAALIHLADVITNTLKIGSSGERLVPHIAPAAWKRLDMDEEELTQLIFNAEKSASELSTMLSQ